MRSTSRPLLLLIAAVIAAGLCASSVRGQTEADDDTPDAPTRELAEAGEAEQETLERFIEAPDWPRRALAAIRLGRYRCAPSRTQLNDLASDDDWRVRSFAITSLALRDEPAPPSLVREPEPRVIRTALRCRYDVDVEYLGRGVRRLERSASLADKMLAIELAAASGDEDLHELGLEALRDVILRMSRSEAGRFGPRLATVTGAPDQERPFRWQSWRRSHRGRIRLEPGYLRPDVKGPLGDTRIGSLTGRQFAALAKYIDELSTRDVELAVCIDCTASMSGELHEAQSGVDDLMLFVGDIVNRFRIGIVGYRDRGADFETVGWDFTPHLDVAREQLWSLSAGDGGDTPEMVYEAMAIACKQMSWTLESDKVLIVIGDAPPRVGTASKCVALAERGAELGFKTHMIEAKGRRVDKFAEIAAAGGGQCIALRNRSTLIIKVAGLALGSRFDAEMTEFFRAYMLLCR